MLEKPDIPDSRLITAARDAYNLPVGALAFLPLGADINTAVYRATTDDGTAYFLRLRRGEFNESAVLVPRYLSDLGISHIIPPLPATDGHLWVEAGGFRLVVYPFVVGVDGYDAPMSAENWIALGAALRRIHDAAVPPDLLCRLPRETYDGRWRAAVRRYLAEGLDGPFPDAIAAETAAFLRDRRDEIAALVNRTERLATVLAAAAPPFVLCHADLHAGNVHIAPGGDFYIVDWDTLVLAPRERDLMYPGGGQGFMGHTAAAEEALFYRGYGGVDVDRRALAYYRYERIVTDIAEFCHQLLASGDDGEDRPQAFRWLTNNFAPDGVLAVAYAADAT